MSSSAPHSIVFPAMSPPGYCDRINHALAFAAKHHDRQVRGGTRLPYFTVPANVAIILTRYDQDDTTVVAGILYEVVADSVRDGATRAFLDQRIGEKFGALALDTVLAVVERRIEVAAVLNRPVAPIHPEEALWAGLFCRSTGDAVSDFTRAEAALFF